MGSATSGFGDEELLAQLGWVRRLAAELVREPAAADDVAQDVARLALEKRATFHGDERGLRAWLAAIARRVAVDRHRAERARANREVAAALARAADAPDDIVERSARARHVADLVHALHEPYRATVLHRYFDGASVAEVARRTQVDEATARKRLQRAREVLRARLAEREGRDARAWLALLAGPNDGALAAAPTALAPTLAGGFAVGSKTWIAVAALVGVTALVAWRGYAPGMAESEQSAPPVAPEVVLDAGSTEPSTPGPDAAAARSALPAPPEAPAPAPESEGRGPLLRVRVVDTAGGAVTEGVLELWSDRHARQTFSRTRVHAAVPIAGVVTDARLPDDARSALVSAAARGAVPSRPAEIGKLVPGETREITLVVGEPLAAPALAGRVLVDGVQRVPRGLAIRVQAENSVAGHGLVNRADATWCAEEVPQHALVLVVTSDETVLARIQPGDAARSSGRFDLELATGRTLELELRARGDGRPLAGAPFSITTSIRIERSTYDSATRLARTDERGRARASGIPREGSFSISADVDVPRRGAVFADGGVESVDWPVEPWIERRVAPEDPDPLRVVLDVDLPRPGASAFGFVPPALDAASSGGKARVVVKEISAARERGGETYEVPRDGEGRWSLRAHWPSRHLVWIQDPKTLAELTEKVEIAFDAAVEQGPVRLPPRHGLPVEIEVHGVPADGVLSLSIHEEGGAARSESLTASGGARRHRIELDRPAKLTLHWRRARASDPQDRELTRRIAVDPARESVAHFDLGGGAGIAVEFAPEGDVLPPGVKLVFARWAGEAGVPDTIVVVSPAGAGGLDDVPLPPGRWVWSCFAPRENVAVYGLVDVAPGAAGVRLAPRVERRPLAGLEHGIVWREVDGFTPGPDAERAWTVRFEAPGEAWIRVDASWTAAGAR